jgi:hypothetical protein
MTRDVGRDVDFRWLVYGFFSFFLMQCILFQIMSLLSGSPAHLLHMLPHQDIDIQ